MATFRKDDQSGRSRPRTTKRSGSEDKDKKKDGYKAKRSFSKNKTFRSDKDTTGGDNKKSFRDKPFRKDERSGEGKPARRFFGSDERPSRANGPRERSERNPGEERPARKSFGSDERPARISRDGAPRERSERSSGGERPARRSFGSDERPTRSSRDGAPRERSERSSGGERPARKSFGSDERPARSSRDGAPRERSERSSGGERPARRSFGSDERPARSSRDGAPRERSERSSGGERPARRSFGSDERLARSSRDGAPRDRSEGSAEEARPTRSRSKSADREGSPERRVKFEEFEEGRAFKKQEATGKDKSGKPKEEGLIRLNKYLANAGISSRREADTLIQSGVVKVNGEVVDQLGFKVKPGDKVTYGDSAVRSERKVYLLLNKPKDYISTVDDPRERKTVMDLIVGACKERIYPVGRLDRNTTGLLLMTNDGELTTKLTHPKFGVKKVYHVTLDKGLRADDFRKIVEGFDLEDGPIKVDDLAFVGEGKKEVGVEIHSGRNRIVRRMFEQLGYDVIKLDRVVFAGLTKKDLPRGKHRFLTAKEISFLQMIG